MHTDILGYPRIDPVGDISHQFSATHAIISLLSALKDVTVSLLQALLKQTVHQNRSTIKTLLFLVHAEEPTFVLCSTHLLPQHFNSFCPPDNF